MEIEEITSQEYSSIFKNPYNVFISVPFNELNKDKCERLTYLLFHEGNIKLGLITGIKEEKLLSPYSAPYGGFSTYHDKIILKYLDDALKLLDKYLIKTKLQQIQLVLPPYFYNEIFLSKVYYSLIHNEYETTYTDLNFHFNLADFANYKTEQIGKRTNDKLKKAISLGLNFVQVSDKNEKLIAYQIVKQNRERKERPLHLSFEQLMDTCKVIPVDFFVVYQKEIPIASAVIFQVAPKIVQLIFWGDNFEYSASNPMYFLSYKLFEFYSVREINIVDLGISTENGDPNYGLCDFKQNIGGISSLKYTFTKNICK
jgi:hypothetical protein